MVLVFLEGRFCLNGEPIRVLPNGKVISINGRADSMQQYYFDVAMKVRNERKDHPEIQGKTGLVITSSFLIVDFSSTLCVGLYYLLWKVYNQI